MDYAFPTGTTSFMAGWIPYFSGFTGTGIVKGSFAAYWQSVGLFDPWTLSCLQSLGATGMYSSLMVYGGGLISVGLIYNYFYPKSVS